MRYSLLFFTLNLLLFCTVGCERAQLRTQFKGLTTNTIILPKKINCVNNGEVYQMPDSLENKPKMIIYVDSTECTTCRISHLDMYHSLLHLSEQKKSFELMILFYNSKVFEDVPLETYLSRLQMETPVYIDVENTFLKDNPIIPSDPRMHSFLINSLGKPIFVGDPVSSEKLKKSFLRAIDESL